MDTEVLQFVLIEQGILVIMDHDSAPSRGGAARADESRI